MLADSSIRLNSGGTESAGEKIAWTIILRSFLLPQDGLKGRK